jgi:hypothetical protein
VQQNLEAEMKKQGIDPKEHFEEAVKKDEAVKHVNPVSNDKGLSAKARNSMRRFRDTIDGARTTDNVTMRDIAHRPPENDTERSAVKQFNALTDRYNEALEHSIESGLPASEKSARAVLLEKYAEDVLKSPLQKDASIPKFADWLKQNIVTADEAKKQEGAKKKV